MSESQSTSSHTRKSDESKSDQSKSGESKSDQSKKDESKSGKKKKDAGLLARVTVRSSRKYIKKRAKWLKDIAEKKRRIKRPRLPDDSTGNELPRQSSRRNPRRNPPILSGRSRIFRKPLSSRPPQDYKELMLIYPSLNTTITDTSASSSDLISFRNLARRFQGIAAFLRQNQPKSIKNLDGSCIKKSSFEPSYIFRDLLYTANNNEAEKISRKWGILQPNFPMYDFSEDQRILGDIRNVFKKEKKLKDSPSQTETLNVQQTVDKDVQNPSDKDNQDCYDWVKFLERWERMHINSESTSEAQRHEHKTIKKPGACVPAKRTIKRKGDAGYSSQSLPFSGQTGKRPRIADSSEMTTPTSFKSTSFERELEMIVHPVSLDVSEISTASKLEKFIKNTKIKLLENNEMSPFLKKIISELENLPHRTNDSYMSINPIRVGENITDGTNNSTDKTEELTGVERDDGDDTEMVS